MTTHRFIRQVVVTSALSLGVGAGVTGAALACGDSAYTGQVCTMAGSFCPRNTAETNGQMLDIQDNPALYALIGCVFGGDCRTTFQLPDIRGRAVVHEGQGPGLIDRVHGSSFGSETVTQSIDQMAPHNHSASFQPVSGDEVHFEATMVPGGDIVPSDGSYLGISLGGNIYTSASSPTVELGGISGGGGVNGIVTLENKGEGKAMPNVPPEIAMRFCIVTDGIFPPRPS